MPQANHRLPLRPTPETPRSELLADGLVTVAEAARFLRLSKSKVYLLMDGGELPYCRFGRSRRIPKRAVVELAERSLNRPSA